MKTFVCSHQDLTALLKFLRAQSIYINEGPEGLLYIMDDYAQAKHREGKIKFDEDQIIFMALPVGRQNEVIFYKCKYADQFDQLLSGEMKGSN